MIELDAWHQPAAAAVISNHPSSTHGAPEYLLLRHLVARADLDGQEGAALGGLGGRVGWVGWLVG